MDSRDSLEEIEDVYKQHRALEQGKAGGSKLTDKLDANNFWNAVISHTLTGGHDGECPFILSKFLEDGSEVPRPEKTTFLHWSIGELKWQKKD